MRDCTRGSWSAVARLHAMTWQALKPGASEESTGAAVLAVIYIAASGVYSR